MQKKEIIPNESIIDFIACKFKKNVRVVKHLPSFEDTNILVKEALTNNEYIVKIFTIHFDDRIRDITEERAKCVSHLEENGFLCTKFLPGTDGWCVQKFEASEDSSCEERSKPASYPALLCTFLHGGELENITEISHPVIEFELGVLLGCLHKDLQLLSHRNLDPDPSDPWYMTNVGLLCMDDNLYVVEDDEQKRRLMQFIKETAGMLESSNSFQKGIVHGDFHGLNIIVNENFKTLSREELFKLYLLTVKHEHSSWPFDTSANNFSKKSLYDCLQEIQCANRTVDTKELLQTYGLIDFGEMSYSYHILELGRVIADLMVTVMSQNEMQQEDSDTKQSLNCQLPMTPHHLLVDSHTHCGDSCCKMEDMESGAVQSCDKSLARFDGKDISCDDGSLMSSRADGRRKSLAVSDIIRSGGYVLSGYATIKCLSPAEVDFLKTAVMASLAQYFVLGKKSMLEHPENKDYTGQCTREAETLFWILDKMDQQVLYEMWTKAVIHLYSGIFSTN